MTLISLPTVAIVGRPNVGKSTLFNLLSADNKGARRAVVHKTAGTTRDAKRVQAELFGLHFTLIDTAGMDADATGLAADLNRLAQTAAKDADVLLFVVDGTMGLTPTDTAWAKWLRKLGKPIVLVVNKADVKGVDDAVHDFARLGFGAPVLLSAAHGSGVGELHEALVQYCAPTENAPPADDDAMIEGEADEALAVTPPRPIRLAIVGKPNAGKSTLVNSLLGREAMLAGPMAGLTREAISHAFTHNGQAFELVDTPGVRRKSKVVESLEGMSVAQAINAIKACDVVVLMVDASTHSIGRSKWTVLEAQDAKIASVIAHLQRPVVVVLNKWDVVEDKEACRADALAQLSHMMDSVHEPAVLSISALQGNGVERILKSARELHHHMMARVSTSKLNRILAAMLAKRPPPLADGKVVSIKFMTQVRSNPPTFALWGNRVSNLPESYMHYLRNQLVEALGLSAVPVRLMVRKSKNPFGKKATKK